MTAVRKLQTACIRDLPYALFRSWRIDASCAHLLAPVLLIPVQYCELIIARCYCILRLAHTFVRGFLNIVLAKPLSHVVFSMEASLAYSRSRKPGTSA